MSKRVANCKGRKTARFKRVRYGWRVKKTVSDLERIDEELAKGDLDDKIRTHYENFKQSALRIIPKRLLQRSQGR